MRDPLPVIEPPNDGPWELDVTHFDRPFARYAADLYVRGFEEGQAGWLERVGMPIKGIRLALVRGLPYAQIVPLSGKPSDALKPMPPRWIMRLMFALHPGFRRRAKAAGRWLEARAWRDEARRWREEVKPALCARFRALEEEPIEALSDEALLDHCARVGEALCDNLRAHFDTNPTTMVPVGAFLQAAMRWTGCSATELLDVARGEPEPPPCDRALRALAAALRALPEAQRGFDLADDAGRALAELRARDDDAGSAARDWLSQVEHRQVSAGDAANPIARELPELLIEQVRRAVGADPPRDKARVDAARIRARVPVAHGAEYDELLADARLVYGIRDERSTLLDVWSGGLLRRAALEAGARLASRGLVREREHVVDLGCAEVATLLRGGGGPSPDEIAARAAERAALSIHEAPRLLGADAMPPMPPLDLFGPSIGRLMESFFCYAQHMEHDAPEPEAPAATRLDGLPASAGRYSGPARVVIKPQDFAKVRQGDVLIARATMPAYNVLLPLVGAIVTDKGGALSHAAIVAREFGLPCVVGTREATLRIADGDVVTVDGDAGTVELSV